MQTKSCYILLWVFFVISTKNNFAQQSIDSVQQIDTVTITEKPIIIEKYSTSVRITTVRSPDVVSYNQQDDITGVLTHFLPIQVNSYGLGNTSSISVRGANDDQTNVYWNGLKINSLTLGGTDLSLIPAMMDGDFINLDKITNAFGGSLSFYSKPDWRNKVDLRFRSDIGSFSSYRNALTMNIGNQKFQFHSNTFYQRAKLDFPFVDVYKFNNPLDTIQHNKLQNAGTLNSFYFKLKKQQYISIGNWFEWKDKETPSIMGSNEISSKFQHDHLVRMFINYDRYFIKREIHFSLAHSYDYLHYTDKRLPADTFLFINSKYKTNRISNSFSFADTFKYSLVLTTGYLYNINLANVQEYVKNVTDHVGEAYARLNWNNTHFTARAIITQPFSSFKYIRPQFNIGARYNTKENHYAVSISYTDKYRFPDLNDRYWNPGGNPNLKPELGWSVNMDNTFFYSKRKDRDNDYVRNTVYLTLSTYYTKIKNNIVWTPVTNVIWSPKNLKTTQLYGIEAQLNYDFSWNDLLTFNLNALYNFNRAQIVKDADNGDLKGNYLPYKPQQMYKINFYIDQKYIGIGLNYIYTSTRFTDEENFEYFALKPYHLLDMYITFKGDIKDQHKFQFILKINNITNTSYESIRSYAQPQRYYTLSFIYNFSKFQNNSQ